MYENIYKQNRNRNITVITFVVLAVIFLAIVSLFTGSSNMTVKDVTDTLIFKGDAINGRIIWNIRIPRIMAAIVAGAGLSLSGLIMQTVLNNPMASPSTLGVSNAAVFGANLSIIAFAGGFLNVGNNLSNYQTSANPYATSLVAFAFCVFSIFLILGLCRIRAFLPGIVVLAGIAIGSIWTAATTVLQFFATDVGISAAVIWNFGDLGRATYKVDLIMSLVVVIAIIVFSFLSWKYNAVLSGDQVAKSVGINVNRLRFLSMLLASLLTAVCVSFLGIIGFIGIIAPHITKKIFGQDHRITIPVSALTGSLILLLSDTFSRTLGNGSALPVGAITSLLGAPFFLFIIFSKRRDY
ncbi:iron complex transport system permease protein [Acetitomaculum ruminis DSM 5522]|uniref:Iron complex transport system permease protein n=1 Tax=Acetitomaculum ruminis DSM 5522 TaxID=1120918 RepID=A0A1I0ZTJ4_9FIRM|nr:iron ABC transporter permease [Acetitomaculum ruminis]SFB28682.1 iron complex transport system permease protein [Acetitomaculum ruminis DSM 5522]